MKPMTKEETEKARAYLVSLGYLTNSKSQEEAENVISTTPCDPSAGNYKYQGILQRGMSKEENAKAIAILKSLGYIDSSTPSAGSNNRKSADKETATPLGSLHSGSQRRKCTGQNVNL